MKKKPIVKPITTFTHVDVLTPSGLIENSSVTIKDNKIHSIGEIHGHIVEMDGYLILPGLINAHTHSPMNFLKDFCHGKESMIENVFFKTESQLNESLTQGLSYSYILSGIKSGVTSFVEHYYFIDGIARAFDKVGVRAYVGETLADLGGAFPRREGLKTFKASIDNWQHSSRITPVLCPHAPDTVSAKLAKQIADFANGQKLSLHFHLSQRKIEHEKILKEYHKSPIELAHEWKWLNERSLAVHVLYANAKDLKILKNSGASITSCPSSQILYEFLAPIDKFYNSGISMLLGTDCAASNDQADMLSELKILALLFKDRGINSSGLYKEIFEMATINPAKALSAQVGKLAPGKFADIVFIKKSLGTLPMRDIWTHILFSYQAQHVDHVMVDGKFVLFDRELCLVSEEELLVEFNKCLSKISI